MNCVECGAETPNLSMVCDPCAPDYADAPLRDHPLVDDTCSCVACATFGHHPDSEIDFAIECEELEAIIQNWHLGHTGMGREGDYVALPHRLGRLLDYQTLNPIKQANRNGLREVIRSLGYMLGERSYEGAPCWLRKESSTDPTSDMAGLVPCRRG